MSGLVDKLEAAEVGSVLLSCDIGIALGKWTPPRGAERDAERPDMWRRDGVNYYQPYAEVTTSLDAALALAERVLGDDWLIEVAFRPVWAGGRKTWKAHVTDGCKEREPASAPTHALALCIAILRALNLNETRHD